MSWEEFQDMDVQEVTNAIAVSGMPKEVIDHIWEKERQPFEVF
jgi:hypothetical protein